MKRPMVVFAVAFALGIWMAANGYCPGLAAPASLVALGLALALTEVRPALTRPLSGAVCLFAVGALLWNARHEGLPNDALARRIAEMGGTTKCVLEGRVRLGGLEQVTAGYHGFLVDVTTVELGGKRLPLTGGAVVGWSTPGAAVHAGQQVRVRGELSTALARVNPGMGSYEDYLRKQGIHTALHAVTPSAVTVLATPRGSPSYWISRLRTAQAASLSRVVPKDALPFVLAVWLGYRTTMPDDEYQSYLKSGTVHILSVSGLHMAMIYVTASFLIGLCVRRPRLRALLCMAAVALFTLMSGMRASALRSAIMVFVYLMAELFDREPDAPTALGESALLLLGFDPEILFDGGFQLSFLCVASMLLFARGVTERLAVLPSLLRGPLATSIAVQILPFPLAILYFNIFPIVSAPANLMLVPLSTVALWLCLLTSVCEFIWHPLGLLFGQALGTVTTLIAFLAKQITAPPFTHWYLSSPTPVAILAYYAMLVCLSALLFRTPSLDIYRRRLWAACCLCACVMVVFWQPLTATPKVVFLDVGHGDAAFIRSKGGHNMLVDTGLADERVNMARKVVAPFLWANHVAQLDAIAISHAQSDHIGGATYLIEHFPVGQVLLGPHPAKDDDEHPAKQNKEQELLTLCERRGIPVHFMHQGDAFALPDMVLTALHPPDTWADDNASNNGGLVLRLDWLGTRFLFAGDIEKSAEASLARSDCRAEILKVPHHGSDTSSSSPFVSAVQPAHVVVSTGGGNTREGLDASILTRYRQRGVRVWRTDLFGAIELFPVREEFHLRSARAERGYPVPEDRTEPAPLTLSSASR